MGYTHYFSVNQRGDQEAWSNALVDVARIVRSSPVPLGDAQGRRSGPEFTDKYLAFNGRGESDSHETFILRNRLEDTEQWSSSPGERGPEWVFEFCKTAYKPYDVVVVAALCRLQEAGLDTVVVKSDGEPEDWTAGQALAAQVLGRPVEIPVGVREPDAVRLAC